MFEGNYLIQAFYFKKLLLPLFLLSLFQFQQQETLTVIFYSFFNVLLLGSF
jgi:hypothetical protein